MPADASVDNRCAGGFDCLGQLHHLFPGAAIFYKIQHRQTVDNDEIFANPLAHAAHDFYRQTDAIFVAAAPTVGTLIGVGDDKFVDEVAFGAHHLNAVIARLLGQLRTAGIGFNLTLNAGLIQFVRRERVDRRLNSRRRDKLGMIGITAGMQNLHADLTARFMHRSGHHFVLFGFLYGIHF